MKTLLLNGGQLEWLFKCHWGGPEFGLPGVKGKLVRFGYGGDTNYLCFEHPDYNGEVEPLSSPFVNDELLLDWMVETNEQTREPEPAPQGP